MEYSSRFFDSFFEIPLLAGAWKLVEGIVEGSWLSRRAAITTRSALSRRDEASSLSALNESSSLSSLRFLIKSVRDRASCPLVAAFHSWKRPGTQPRGINVFISSGRPISWRPDNRAVHDTTRKRASRPCSDTLLFFAALYLYFSNSRVPLLLFPRDIGQQIEFLSLHHRIGTLNGRLFQLCWRKKLKFCITW